MNKPHVQELIDAFNLYDEKLKAFVPGSVAHYEGYTGTYIEFCGRPDQFVWFGDSGLTPVIECMRDGRYKKKFLYEDYHSLYDMLEPILTYMDKVLNIHKHTSKQRLAILNAKII